MSTVPNLHGMTLAEANVILAGIGYDPEWSVPELLSVCAPLTEHHRKRVQTALRVTAAADAQEATSLEAYAADTPAATPKGSPLDLVQAAAWRGLIEYLIGESWAVTRFVSETGHTGAIKPRTLEDALASFGKGLDTDEAQERFASAFVRWATANFWGANDQITPTIRGILDNLPEGS